MSTLAIYDFENDVIRTAVGINGEPLVCASDLAKACGLRNPNDAYRRVDETYRGIGSTDTLGGNQQMVYLTEPGVYQLLLGIRPRKGSPTHDKVQRLQKWVCQDVLPSIRKTGTYSMPGSIASSEPVYDEDDELSVLLASHLKNRNEVLRVKKEQERQLAAIRQVQAVALEADGKATQAMDTAIAVKETVTNFSGHVSALGYARTLKLSIPLPQLGVIGKLATRACLDRGFEPSKVNDPRYGSVNVYPTDVLDSLRDEFIKRAK